MAKSNLPPFSPLVRWLSAVSVAASLAVASAQTNGTWLPTTAGTFAWDDAANWSPGTAFPDGIGAVANLNNNIAGTQIIQLNQAITVGTLNFGDSASAFSPMTLAAGTGGTLTFQVASGNALLARTVTTNPNVTDVISANVILNSPLTVSVPWLSNFNGIRITGEISGANGINLVTPTLTSGGVGQFLDLTHLNNNYTGETVVSNGTLSFRGSVLSGQNSALGNATSAIRVGSPDTLNSPGVPDLQHTGGTITLRLQASGDASNYEISRGVDFSGNPGTASQNGRAQFTLDADGAGGLNTNTLTLSGPITLPSGNGRLQFLAAREGQTIYFTGNITSPVGANGTLFYGAQAFGTPNADGGTNGIYRFSDVARPYSTPQSLTNGTMIIEGSVPASGASPIGTSGISMTDGNGGNFFSTNTTRANRNIFLSVGGSTFARGLTFGGGSGTNLATSTINGVAPATYHPLYGNSGSVNLLNGYQFGGLNTSGTVTFSGNIAAGTVTVPGTGTAGGAGGTNAISIVHNIALIAATGGTSAFTGVLSGNTAPVLGSTTTPGAAVTGNNTRITINQFRNHPNLDANVDGLPDAHANQLVGTATQGTVILSAANTYGGGTEVLGGTLLVNNTTGSGSGTGPVWVTAGTTLGGIGTLRPTGANGILIDGTVAPGTPLTNDGVGRLSFDTVDGSLVFAASSQLVFELYSNGTNGLAITLDSNGFIDTIGGSFNGTGSDSLAFNSTGLGLLNFTNATAGSLGVIFGTGYTPQLGDAFDLLDFNQVSGLSTSLLTLPNLSSYGADWVWDDTKFTSHGVIAITTVIPEPSRAALCLLAGLATALRRRRSLPTA
jgi:autotransporter-associated beta strand protein